ncbi:GNAT family N-acetyltransferase [Micromonospora sp. NPDC047074]|uniref:GNAT family N-acetyltransferase n=1 Tax=Micromonospora sp. NPDC047074 TaxID=3154339 RepID=UPI0033DB682D
MTVDTLVTNRREAYREQLADLLDREVAELADGARLADQLHLDSLAMMSLLAWLDEHGVALDAGHPPASVGDVLTLLERATGFPGLSIQVVDARAGILANATAPGPARPRPAADPLVPVLADRLVRLTAVVPDDIGFLYSLATTPETCFRWRYRGAPPSLDRFVEDLWRQVLVQFVARRAEDGQPIGQVVAYAADPAMRHLYVGAVFHPGHTGAGLAARSVERFVRYLFHTFPLHKIYFEVPGFNWPQVSSGRDRFFRVEGVLRDHDYHAGRHWDQYLCAVYRDEPGTPGS